MSKMSVIGEIVDSPLEEFKESIVNGEVPLGLMNNIYHYLCSAYETLVQQKDGLISSISKESDGDTTNEKKSLVQCIYVEMGKIEEKALFLKSRIAVVENMELDTSNHQ